MGHHWTWYSLVPGLDKVPAHVTGAATVLVLLTIISLVVRRKYAASDGTIPDQGISLRSIAEVSIEKLIDLTEGVIGKEGRDFFPFLGALFIYIFISNMMGLIPGFLPPTDSLNTNGACAIIVFIYYNYLGFKKNGASYLKHFTGPIWWLAILMIPIEIVGHLARPFSLSVRLFGNINGDHMVLSIFTDLTKLVIPVAFYALGLFVAFIQALVFTLLSMVYINISISHEH
ncbi:MAG: F0F1 ATP synthase subunit A [Deltaproteobacteria bacterium]|nr:F0F1 ATP synthase subunit A [Deltaproteobacteria bacterium]